MKIWILLCSHINNDQPRVEVRAWWRQKPSPEQLMGKSKLGKGKAANLLEHGTAAFGVIRTKTYTLIEQEEAC